jgi:hypothetical protein
MGRHVAVRKASATVAGARGGAALGRTAGTAAGTGLGSVVGGVIGGALGSIIPGAGTAAGAALGSSLGGAAGGATGGVAGGVALGAAGGAGGAAVDAAKLSATGAKNVAVAGKNAAQAKIGEVGTKEVGTVAAGMAQNQANAQAAQSQQTMQNNIQSAKDTANDAKNQAGIEKAWKFPARMMHPEFKSYRDSIIERAKKAPRQDEDFLQDQHWNERMGHKKGRPQEARYIPNQHFEHENKVHNITPFQVAYATLQHMKENRLIDENNHDSVALRELLHTDQPHPDPNQMQSQMAHIFSPVMDIETMRGKSAHSDPIDPKGAKTQHVYPQDVVKPDNLSYSSQEKIAVRPKSIVNEYMPGKRAKPSKEELIDSFIDTPVSDLEEKFSIEDDRLAGQEYIAQSKYEKEQAEQQAAQQAQQEAQAKEEQFQQQAITVTDMGGVFFVTDPAYGYNKKMMDYQQLVQGGYDKYLNNDNKSEPMDLAWQMLFKAGVEVHHDEPLPQEFTQDITTLDRQHKMVPTENGTMIDNISPHMLRTIELMAQNHKDDDTFTPKPFEMPTTFY